MNATDGMKRCSRGAECVHPDGPLLPATAAYFYRNKGASDGLHPQCKRCHDVRTREYAARPDQRRKAVERTRRWQREHPEQVRAQKRADYRRHREARLARSAAWAKANPERNRAKALRHRHKKRAATATA